jgi:acyl-CoA dehydrogenase
MVKSPVPSAGQLPEPYGEIRAQAREVAASIAGFAARADEADSVDGEVRDRLAASGLARLAVPARFGGRFADVDALAVTVVREEFAAESSHLDSLFAMQGIGSYALSRGGASAVQERWLPEVAAMAAIPALGLTEPAIGSDLKAVTTRIEQDGDQLVVCGHKSFITNAGDASYYAVLGREGEAYSLVLVPATSSGLSVRRPHQVIASHVIGDVVLDGVRVPADHRIGPPGGGFDLVLATLATFRVSVAGAAVGMASAALREAIAHTSVREQFGVPLARLGAVSSLLAQSWTDLEMARSLTYRAAAAAAGDPRASLHLSSLAKVGATEAAGRIVDRSVQVMGRFGIVRGSKIERLYRGVRPLRIYEGASETLWDSLARKLVRDGI